MAMLHDGRGGGTEAVGRRSGGARRPWPAAATVAAVKPPRTMGDDGCVGRDGYGLEFEEVYMHGSWAGTG